MDNDRELLEDAAKAAGFKTWNNEWWAMCDGENYWDPLRHNGQALRLAVKRKIFRCHMDLFHRFYEEAIAAGLDERAATRRAIVRAAAEIGKAMPAPGAMEGGRS
jgi:hypothetical protein